MATSFNGSCSGPVIGFQRSTSPPRRFCSSSSSSPSASSSGFAYSSSSFFSRSTGFFQQSSSPTFMPATSASSPQKRSCMCSPPNHPGSFRCSLHKNHNSASQKKSCMCSPSTHPGAFRCSLHKTNNSNKQAASYTSDRVNVQRLASGNSLVRVGPVEGEWVRRALAARARPSLQQKRKAAFQPRPSRLSVMTRAEDL